jgi:pimeloyl-ACP methyl ester carboxylesterase
LPLLAAERRVIVMHYRGHGQSPTPPRPWRLDLEVLAGDAYAILDKVGATPAIAVGFSMGFSVALELWRWRRPSLAGIVNLAGPPGRVLADLEPTDALGQALPFVIAATRSASDLTLRLWKRVLPSPFARLVAMRTQVNASRLAVSDFEVYLRQLAEVNPELFIALLDAANAYDPRGFLADIDVPVLVVAGAQDKFVGLETLRRTAFALPRGQFQVFPDASHAIPAEYPHEVARRIDRFARELEGETVVAR